ncbi:glycosyltransferase family 4 protein [Herbiconiux sp. SYSU D00978]|uniref:glycosyltransferase family 4 protein n=1 Tax=Herbiconiux sp. SYSU D00978 TaxID=2812562 RepID=UPI001A972598|nr:glycosyltransferase [Herbiconiux sp. SYSU D00978]
MPHSPSIKADEEAMVAELMGRVLDTAGFRKAEQQIIDEADLVVFPTRDAAAEYFAAFDGDGRLTSKSRYIESGVPASNFEPRPRRDGSIGVIFVGRFVPHKGYDLFVDAAETLARRDFAAEFRTLGTGLQARDSAHVKNLGWSETPSEHLLDADVVVVPNRVAYFDLLPLEAAALGRGLVMTTVGGNRDQLKALPDSVGCAPQDLAEGIAQAVHLARTDITWGTANRRVFLERFTDSAMAARWVKLLEDCANVAS